MKYTSKSAPILSLFCAIFALLLLAGCASLSGTSDSGETTPVETDLVTATPEPDTTATPAPEPTETPSPEPTNTPAEATAADAEYPLVVDVGSTVSVDLNGDGSAEEVFYDAEAVDYSMEQTLTVNGVDYLAAAHSQGFYSENPATDCYCITDIDTSDGLLEIAVMDYGPSSDCTTSFFRYDGTGLTYIGWVNDLAASSELYGWLITFNGDGTVSSTIRLSVLQTWFAPASWTVPESPGAFDVIPQTLYYCVPSFVVSVTTIAPVVAYTDMDASSEKSVLPLGTVLSLTATDNESWVLAEPEDGSGVWIHLGGDYGYDVETEGGYLFCLDALEGLCMAD